MGGQHRRPQLLLQAPVIHCDQRRGGCQVTANSLPESAGRALIRRRAAVSEVPKAVMSAERMPPQNGLSSPKYTRASRFALRIVSTSSSGSCQQPCADTSSLVTVGMPSTSSGARSRRAKGRDLGREPFVQTLECRHESAVCQRRSLDPRLIAAQCLAARTTTASCTSSRCTSLSTVVYAQAGWTRLSSSSPTRETLPQWLGSRLLTVLAAGAAEGRRRLGSAHNRRRRFGQPSVVPPWERAAPPRLGGAATAESQRCPQYQESAWRGAGLRITLGLTLLDRRLAKARIPMRAACSGTRSMRSRARSDHESAGRLPVRSALPAWPVGRPFFDL